jgi:signal transduction histidine kinase
VQEALTNTIRHAPAAMATVTFTYEPGYITVSVTDSVPSASFAPVASMPTPGGPAMTSARPAAAGPATAGPTESLATAVGPRSSLSANGATAAAAGVPGPAGFGLAGIAARVASCGGTLIMGPTPAGGFTITARLPA